MVLFARLLRAGGLDVTPQQMTLWVRALERIDLTRRQDTKNATRTALVSRVSDLEWFDLAFDLFWQARDPRQLEELELGLLVQRTTERSKQAAIARLGQESSSETNETHETGVYGTNEILRHKDFAEMNASELHSVKRLIRTMRLDLDTRRTRRLIAQSRGPKIDLRRSLRGQMRSGGELLRLERQTRRTKPRNLVLLCDISGSMEPYARLLLHFIYAVCHRGRTARGATRAAARGASSIEAFVFGTRLTRITRELRTQDPDLALQNAAERIEDWGGGTRTGEALRSFHLNWSRRVLGHGAVVLIISDGWDRGDIPLLEREMARLYRTAHRVIWLNPLLGTPGYQPLTRGMQAALPHIHDFLPVHNLHSLEQLAHHLSQLAPKRSNSKASRNTRNKVAAYA